MSVMDHGRTLKWQMLEPFRERYSAKYLAQAGPTSIVNRIEVVDGIPANG